MRTTSSVEATNILLNDNAIKHGKMFTFIHDLRLEDYLNYQNLKRCIESGGKPRAIRSKYKVRKLIHIYLSYLLIIIFLFRSAMN